MKTTETKLLIYRVEVVNGADLSGPLYVLMDENPRARRWADRIGAELYIFFHAK